MLAPRPCFRIDTWPLLQLCLLRWPLFRPPLRLLRICPFTPVLLAKTEAQLVLCLQVHLVSKCRMADTRKLHFPTQSPTLYMIPQTRNNNCLLMRRHTSFLLLALANHRSWHSGCTSVSMPSLAGAVTRPCTRALDLQTAQRIAGNVQNIFSQLKAPLESRVQAVLPVKTESLIESLQMHLSVGWRSVEILPPSC